MKTDINELDNQIDRYLLGKMSQKEKEEFEKLLQEDEQLLDEVLLRKDVIVAVHVSVKEKLKQIVNQKAKEKTKTVKGKYIVIAIIIFGILSLLLVLLFKIMAEK